MRRAVVIRGTHLAPDPRAEKHAALLSELGWDVTVLGWDRTASLPHREMVELGGRAVTLERLPVAAGYGNGLRNLGPLLRWQRALWGWLWARRRELELTVAIDLDTVVPALRLQDRAGVPLVYDIADFYAESRGVPSFARGWVARWETAIARRARAVVLCDPRRAAQFQGRPPERFGVVYNSPAWLPEPVHRAGPFTVVYIGILGPWRKLPELVKLFARRAEWRLVIGGFGALEAELGAAAEAAPGVTFLGAVKPYSRALELMAGADALVAFYDPAVPNHRYSSPNKLFEAMGLGKPLVVAEGTGMDAVVREHGLGEVVDYGDDAGLEAAFARLASWGPTEREAFSTRARARYRAEFGPEAMKAAMEAVLGQAGVA